MLVQKLFWDWPCGCVCSNLSLWGGSQRGPVLPAGIGGWGTWSWCGWFIWLCFRQISLSSSSETPKCVSAAQPFCALSLLVISMPGACFPCCQRPVGYCGRSVPWTVSQNLLLEQNTGFNRVWSSLLHIQSLFVRTHTLKKVSPTQGVARQNGHCSLCPW